MQYPPNFGNQFAGGQPQVNPNQLSQLFGPVVPGQANSILDQDFDYGLQGQGFAPGLQGQGFGRPQLSVNHRILRYVVDQHLLGRYQGQQSYGIVNRVNNVFQRYGLRSSIVSNAPGGWVLRLNRRENIPDNAVIEVLDTVFNFRPQDKTLQDIGQVNQQLLGFGSNLQVVPRANGFKTVRVSQ